jgi:hypothetical protein
MGSEIGPRPRLRGDDTNQRTADARRRRGHDRRPALRHGRATHPRLAAVSIHAGRDPQRHRLGNPDATRQREASPSANSRSPRQPCAAPTAAHRRTRRQWRRECSRAAVSRPDSSSWSTSPQLQRTYRSATRTVARVDAEFADGLIVELAGHGIHASRVQRQRDAERHTELTLRNKRVITFTYDDVLAARAGCSTYYAPPEPPTPPNESRNLRHIRRIGDWLSVGRRRG